MNKELVERNLWLTKVYLSGMIILAGVLGGLVSQVFGWGLTGTGSFLVVAGIIDLVAFYFSDRLVVAANGAKPLTETMAPEVHALVQKIAIKAGVPKPKLYLLNEMSINAFATGRDEKYSVVALTRGAIEKLTEEELEGVIAHEISHIKNLDIRLAAIVSVLAGMISIVADMIWHSQIGSRVSEKDQSGVTAWIAALAALSAPMAAMFIQMAMSRQREYLADASAANINNNGEGLIKALDKISRDRLPLTSPSLITAHMYISNPLSADGWLDKLMSSHPPVEERINRLKTK